jgi:hypothetical protein
MIGIGISSFAEPALSLRRYINNCGIGQDINSAGLKNGEVRISCQFIEGEEPIIV